MYHISFCLDAEQITTAKLIFHYVGIMQIVYTTAAWRHYIVLKRKKIPNIFTDSQLPKLNNGLNTAKNIS